MQLFAERVMRHKPSEYLEGKQKYHPAVLAVKLPSFT
jgi:hypothetical protein